MISLTLKYIVDYTGGNLVYGYVNREIENIVIDSRQADEKSMFVAVIGDSQDGHRYIKSAYDNGCRVFLISDDSYLDEGLKGASVIKVENTEIALGMIAKNYRARYDIPVIGVTGSVGKTTTRDMIYSVVNHSYFTLKNEKNLNNQFGVPLTLFNLNDEYEAAVIEMGMSGFKEIEYLVDIVRPQIGVISNIGMSHIQHLGSQEGIFHAKMEITSFFGEDSILIVNGDDKFLTTVYNKYISGDELGYKVRSFGKNPKCSISLLNYRQVGDYETEFSVEIAGVIEKFRIPTVGEHNIYNAMSAILVGLQMNISLDDIRIGLMEFIPTKDRQDVIMTDMYTIINDVYNASPDSMVASMKVLGLYNNRKVAILGDCLEMGKYEEVGHRSIGAEAAGLVDVLITTGDAAKYISLEAIRSGLSPENVYYFRNKDDLIDALDDILLEGDSVLVKASRGMKFEDIVNNLKGGREC